MQMHVMEGQVYIKKEKAEYQTNSQVNQGVY